MSFCCFCCYFPHGCCYFINNFIAYSSCIFCFLSVYALYKSLKYITGLGSNRPGKVLEFDLGPGKLLEFEKSIFCVDLSWNFVKSSLKIWISPWKILDNEFFQIYGICKKKTVWKSQKKTESKSLDTRRRARWNSYFIQFVCSPRFYHWNLNQWKLVRLFTSTFPAGKSAFFSFYTKLGRNWVIEKWKKKVLAKSWNSVFPFTYELLMQYVVQWLDEGYAPFSTILSYHFTNLYWVDPARKLCMHV